MRIYRLLEKYFGDNWWNNLVRISSLDVLSMYFNDKSLNNLDAICSAFIASVLCRFSSCLNTHLIIIGSFISRLDIGIPLISIIYISNYTVLSRITIESLKKHTNRSLFCLLKYLLSNFKYFHHFTEYQRIFYFNLNGMFNHSLFNKIFVNFFRTYMPHYS